MAARPGRHHRLPAAPAPPPGGGRDPRRSRARQARHLTHHLGSTGPPARGQHCVHLAVRRRVASHPARAVEPPARGADAAAAPDRRHRHAHPARRRRATCSPAVTQVMGGPLSPLFYDEPLEIVQGRGPVAVRRRRHPLPGRLQQRRRRRPRPSGRRPGRHPAAGRREHPLALPAPQRRRARRATPRHDAAGAGHLPVHHVGHRGQRPGVAPGHRLHRRNRRDHRRARLPRFVEVVRRPQPQRVAARPPAGARRHLRRAARRDRRHRPRRPRSSASRAPPTSCAPAATPPPSCWPTSASRARASSTPPTSSSRALVDGAHQAGALFLADEVQVGYGRVGPAMWRFAAHGLVPDLVTLGKPMGAGYPSGPSSPAATSPTRWPATTSTSPPSPATPAAAAAALAVLDTLEAGSLPEQAAVVGDYLRERLRDLAAPDASTGRGARHGSHRRASTRTTPQERSDAASSRAFSTAWSPRGVLAGLPARAVRSSRSGRRWSGSPSTSTCWSRRWAHSSSTRGRCALRGTR